MTAFVDTSALFALLDRDDPAHRGVAQAFEALLDDQAALVTHSYVLVESFALVQRRLGLPAVHALRDDLLPIVAVTWVDEQLHGDALTALTAAGRRSVSLVDHASFAFMRRRGIRRALAVDRHFAEQGFELLG